MSFQSVSQERVVPFLLINIILSALILSLFTMSAHVLNGSVLVYILPSSAQTMCFWLVLSLLVLLRLFFFPALTALKARK